MADIDAQPTKPTQRSKRKAFHRYSEEAVQPPKPVPAALRSGKMPEGTFLALKLMLQGGATDADIAQALQIPVSTLYNWKRQHYELSEVMRISKEGFDVRIERALAQSAIGYSYESEEIKVIEGEVVRVPIRVHVPPSNTAQIFWLKNRQPWLWRDKHDLELSGDLNITEVADDRKLAMQMLALLREATNQPLIEGTTNAPEARPGPDDARPDETRPSEGRRRRFA